MELASEKAELFLELFHLHTPHDQASCNCRSRIPHHALTNTSLAILQQQLEQLKKIHQQEQQDMTRGREEVLGELKTKLASTAIQTSLQQYSTTCINDNNNNNNNNNKKRKLFPSMESPNESKRKRHDNVEVLQEWLLNNIRNPYPSHEEKLLLAKQSDLSFQQVSNWFLNARKRYLRPLLKSNQSYDNTNHTDVNHDNSGATFKDPKNTSSQGHNLQNGSTATVSEAVVGKVVPSTTLIPTFIPISLSLSPSSRYSTALTKSSNHCQTALYNNACSNYTSHPIKHAGTNTDSDDNDAEDSIEFIARLCTAPNYISYFTSTNSTQSHASPEDSAPNTPSSDIMDTCTFAHAPK